jgi:hypothetical protein
MTTRRTAALGIALGILVAACGSSGPKSAMVTRSVLPNPVVAVPGPQGRDWAATFTLTLKEEGGVGARVSTVASVVYESVGGVATTAVGSNFSSVEVGLPSSRLEPNGTLDISFAVTYTLPGGGRAAVVHIVLEYVDDEGQPFRGTVDVPIT